MKYLLCSTGSCCWSILQQDALMLSQYDFQFCMDWHQTHQNGSLLSPPPFLLTGIISIQQSFSKIRKEKAFLYKLPVDPIQI